MAKYLYRLGRGAAKHRGITVLLWLAVLVTLGITSVTLSGSTSNSFSIPGQESTKALEIMEEKFGSGTSGAGAQVVLQSTNGEPITSPDNASKVASAVAELQALPDVATVVDPFASTPPTVSEDLTSTYVQLSFPVIAADLTEEQTGGLMDAVDNARTSGLTAEVTGEATEGAFHASAAEAIGVVVALIVLLLTFGSLLAAGMNLLTALVGVAIGLLGITTATGFMDLQAITPALASMLGLAVGIDYALFIVTRFRQQLQEGDDPVEAAAMAVGTAGSAVLTAGLTVVIALCGLAIANIPFLTQMGVAAAATVIVAVLVAITLVPAVLAYIGRRALPKRHRDDAPSSTHLTPRFFVGWAAMVTNHRWKVLIAAIAVLGVIAIPAASLQTALEVRAAQGSTEEKAQTIIADKFGPGVSGPLLVLVDGEGAGARAAEVVTEASSIDGVVAVLPSGALPDDSAALVTIIPASGPSDERTEEIVHQLRDEFAADNGPETYVTGQTAIGVDISESLSKALPIYLIVVVGLAFVLLVLVFRSILVPLVGVVGFLLTVGASFGSLVAVFQWGWLSDIFQPGAPGPILSFAPLLVIGILFGLAMDYQVFLVSRMHEAHAKGAAPKEAIVAGFKSSAPVVLAAATIMFGVFAGFLSGDATIKLVAFALAVGIVFDAVVVRMLLVPAAMTLLGRSAWWFPSWLSWLPELDVEGQALERQKAAEQK